MALGDERLILLSSLDTTPTTTRVEHRRPLQSLHLVLCRPLWGQQPVSPDWQEKWGQKQTCADPGVLTCPLRGSVHVKILLNCSLVLLETGVTFMGLFIAQIMKSERTECHVSKHHSVERANRVQEGIVMPIQSYGVKSQTSF